MEMNYMLAYGSAEASLRLLWKFGLLEILLPIQVWRFPFLLINMLPILQSSLRLYNISAMHRLHISFPRVFEDAIRDLTCFW